MPIPDSPRVRYELNPLNEVSCKLQFPRILSIGAKTPVEFQDRVRVEFPHFQVDSNVKFPVGLPDEVARLIRRDLPAAAPKSYLFASADRSWNLKLTDDIMSLSTSKYESWEEFCRLLSIPFEALGQVYKPAFFTHVCVRYKNVIRRSVLGLEDGPWSGLVRPWIGGPFGEPGIAEEVEAVQSRCVIGLSERGGKIDANYGLATEELTKEEVFLIDSHVYTSKQTERTDVFDHLDAFNRAARHFFRWCITDQLHRALGPVGLDAPAR